MKKSNKLIHFVNLFLMGIILLIFPNLFKNLELIKEFSEMFYIDSCLYILTSIVILFIKKTPGFIEKKLENITVKNKKEETFLIQSLKYFMINMLILFHSFSMAIFYISQPTNSSYAAFLVLAIIYLLVILFDSTLNYFLNLSKNNDIKD